MPLPSSGTTDHNGPSSRQTTRSNQTSPIDLEENIPLAPFTTLKIGGPARYFVRAATEDDVAAAFDLAEDRGLNLFVLGGGSNILVSDRGFDGLVLQVAIRGVRQAGSEVFAAAGEDWEQFVEYCVDKGLAGVECLSGIPGFVGGTPVQNVGAYGQEVSETIASVRCFDRERRETVELSNEECGFHYRKSIFNSTARDRYIVLAVKFRLTEGGEPKIVYKDLKEILSGGNPTLRETREAVLKIRRAKSMVIDPADPNSRSAGSFFKNPIVPSERIDQLRSAAGDANVPTFPASPGSVKVPAAWLIERAGFHKGFRLGNAGISSNHSLALVNLGGASAAEMVELKNLIQTAVLEKFRITLEPEPIFVGFPS